MVRVRYAPSPTGDLHLGSLRTIIFDFLIARQKGGQFVLRVEDTDQKRLVEGSLERQLEAMEWMGLLPDEGVTLENGQIVEKGPYGPYTQSKRLDIYQKHVTQLLEAGDAYRCFCTAERLEQMRAEQQANHQPPRYDRHCRALSKEESEQRAASEPFVIRHKIPDNQEIQFTDVVRGELTFQSSEFDDYVLLKSDGFPTYHLASVVDDHLMEITHVLRGEEWLPSLPKNLLLYQAFGWAPPAFAHLPVILGADGRHKLSKRDGDVAVIEYREKGYLPHALFNTLAFLGWSPGTEQEFLTLDEFVHQFSLERVQKAPAKFSFDRLDFVNGWYIRHLPVAEVADQMKPYLEASGITPSDGQYLLTVAATLQERLKHFDETVEVSWFFFKRPEVTAELRQLIIPKKGDAETTQNILHEVVGLLTGLAEGQWKLDILQELLYSFTETHQYKNMEVLWPIRAALTGVQASPGTFEMLVVLGKEESLARLQAVLS